MTFYYVFLWTVEIISKKVEIRTRKKSLHFCCKHVIRFQQMTHELIILRFFIYTSSKHALSSNEFLCKRCSVRSRTDTDEFIEIQCVNLFPTLK